VYTVFKKKDKKSQEINITRILIKI